MFQGRAGAHSSRRLASFGPRPRFEGRAVWRAAARFGAELHRRDFKDGGGLVTMITGNHCGGIALHSDWSVFAIGPPGPTRSGSSISAGSLATLGFVMCGMKAAATPMRRSAR